MRIRHLRMRAKTPAGPYGADIRFASGLNVIWADNTKGKSTCMQGMLYALGLERMLSPRREVPLPHAMTSFLKNDDETQLNVLESTVSLEIENGAKQVITVHRSIKNALVDNRLISVDFGPTLTDKTVRTERRNFFVVDGGAAKREDGFHHFLEQFLGWQLPLVRRYEGSDCKLYLETIFPLFWVEHDVPPKFHPAAS
nr:ATP-binding protein [Methylosinus sp. KRF6]